MRDLRITTEVLRAWRPCKEYAENGYKKVRQLIGADGKPLSYCLTKLAIPFEHKVWVAAKALPADAVRLLVADIAERALLRDRDHGFEMDMRSLDVVRFTRQYVRGECSRQTWQHIACGARGAVRRLADTDPRKPAAKASAAAGLASAAEALRIASRQSLWLLEGAEYRLEENRQLSELLALTGKRKLVSTR